MITITLPWPLYWLMMFCFAVWLIKEGLSLYLWYLKRQLKKEETT